MTENPIEKTISSSGVYFVTLGLASFLTLILVPIYTRLFGPCEYGYLSLTLATISLLSVFTYGPISASIVRFLPEFDESKNEKQFYTTSFIITAFCTSIVSLLYCIGLLVLRKHINPFLFKLLSFGVFVLIGNSFFNTFLSIFRARQNAKQYGILIVLNKCLGLFMGLYFIFVLSQGIMGVLVGYLVALIVLNTYLFFYFKKKVELSRDAISIKVTSKIMFFGLPLIFSLLSQWILNVSDIYMIKLFRGDFEVGIYSVGYNIAFKSITMLTIPFITALTPAIINLWRNDRSKAKFNLQKLSRYFFMLSLPCLIGFSVLSKPIISILSTPEYYKGQLIMPFVSIGAFFWSLYSLSYTGLIIHGKTRLIAKIITISAILNIILNLALIPRYGFLGAGISTMMAYFLAFIMADRLSSKYLRWKPIGNSFNNIFFASIVMGIVVYSIGNIILNVSAINLILEILIGCIVYLTLLFILKEIGNKELNKMKLLVKSNLFFSKK